MVAWSHCSVLSSTCVVFLSLISDLFTIQFSPTCHLRWQCHLCSWVPGLSGCTGTKRILCGELSKTKLQQEPRQAWSQHLMNGWASTWEPLVCRLSMRTGISMGNSSEDAPGLCETHPTTGCDSHKASQHVKWVTVHPNPSPTTSDALPQAQQEPQSHT